MRTRIHNRTGLSIHTSAHASSPALALVEAPVEMPTAAWEHTLVCGPGLRSLVGEGPGKIEVSEVEEIVLTIGDVSFVPTVASGELIEVKPEPAASADPPVDLTFIDPVLDALTVAARPAFVPKGKRR